MAEPIQVPNLWDTILTKEKSASILFHTWMELITEAVNATPPLTGIGTPEAAVVASPGRWFVDTSAAVGTGIYFKESGDGNTGWEARS